MIILHGNALEFLFPEVHPDAGLRVAFHRTLRVPQDGREYPLPAGLGQFPIVHVEDLPNQASVPSSWRRAGGVLIPMYPSEAMWMSFNSSLVKGYGPYPSAVKVAAGKINATTGEPLNQGPPGEHQDYVVSPTQRWLDGFCTGPGVVRQFVAEQLGSGLSVEEQVWGWAETGGVQLLAYPMTRRAFEDRFAPKPKAERDVDIRYSVAPAQGIEMGLSPGGRIKQKIHKDPYRLNEWYEVATARCFVRLIHYKHWLEVTGHAPPHEPIGPEAYRAAGIPWYAEYSDGTGLPGSSFISKMRSAFGPPPPARLPLKIGSHVRQIVDTDTGTAVTEGEF